MQETRRLHERAEQFLVGGVSAGWNYFPESGPLYIKDARGAHLYDADGNEYIDYVVGWGSLLLGHNPQPLRKAILNLLDRGFCHQYETELHIRLAESICAAVPCAERVRFANSGLEATLYALRLARHHTGKRKVLKFEGHFHGLHDYLLFGTDASSSPGAPLDGGELTPMPGSSGIPNDIRDLIVIVPFNDVEAFEQAIRRHRADLAAVIMEPIALNIGCIAPDEGFLQRVRDVTAREGIVLIFDEVLTGFRVAPGGAQQYYHVTPDLACLGKALGCGMPIAALVGKKELMDGLVPNGDVQMSGTNTGRLLTVAGSLAAVQELLEPSVQRALADVNARMTKALRSLLERRGVPAYVEGYGGRIGVYVGIDERPRTLREITLRWNRSFHMQCYREFAIKHRLYGFFLPLRLCPEAVTLCLAHTHADIEETLNHVETVLKAIPYREL